MDYVIHYNSLQMILSFRNQGSEDLFNGIDSKAARAICPETIHRVARRKFDQLNQALELRDLSVPLGNRLEPLSGDRAGLHSIRINEQYRICFLWTKDGVLDVEITDYH